MSALRAIRYEPDGADSSAHRRARSSMERGCGVRRARHRPRPSPMGVARHPARAPITYPGVPELAGLLRRGAWAVHLGSLRERDRKRAKSLRGCARRRRGVQASAAGSSQLSGRRGRESFAGWRRPSPNGLVRGSIASRSTVPGSAWHVRLTPEGSPRRSKRELRRGGGSVPAWAGRAAGATRVESSDGEPFSRNADAGASRPARCWTTVSALAAGVVRAPEYRVPGRRNRGANAARPDQALREAASAEHRSSAGCNASDGSAACR